jgi:hypothetical protein
VTSRAEAYLAAVRIRRIDRTQFRTDEPNETRTSDEEERTHISESADELGRRAV